MGKRRIGQATATDHYEAWQRFRDSFRSATPVDHSETVPERIRRMNRQQNEPEEWFKYYFPNYCTAPSAAFHRRATQRLLTHPEWYEVRAWSRELAKSARSMMEIIFLAMTGQVRNVLLVSNTQENAERLLLPFKACFEANNRLINDYGRQERIGQWTASEFVIEKGCSFRALGWGQSPRGTRKDNVRPDFILIDDIDTDEECRNEDIMTKKVNWIEQALIGTRSISTPTRILVNGNIIHDNCAVKRLAEKADKFEIVNIRDKDGRSSWPEKNSEADIDRVLSLISYESTQKEYFNNPMDEGQTFKDIRFGRVPRLDSGRVLIYADPSTSNKDRTSGSDKAVGLLMKKGMDYFVVRAAVDTMSSVRFIETLFDFHAYALQQKAVEVRVYVENNTLQDPFYEQVFLPLIHKMSEERGVLLPITPDARKKPEKWSRIEGTLEPVNRLGHLIFNQKEEDDPGMKRLVAQFRSASRRQKKMDGPDMVEGGVFLLRENDAADTAGGVEMIRRTNKLKW